MADLRELIMKWRIAAKNAGKARAKAFTRCADELERALAAQPAPIGKPFAYAADVYPGERDDSGHTMYILAPGEDIPVGCTALYLAAQPATVPESNRVPIMWRDETPYGVGYSASDEFYAAFPAFPNPPSPDHSPGAGKMVTEAQAGADDEAKACAFSRCAYRNQGGCKFGCFALSKPKPAEGGAVAIMQALLNKLHSVANEHGDRSCDYDVCKEVRDAFQFIQTAGSGEAVGEILDVSNHGRPSTGAAIYKPLPPRTKLFAGAPPAADAEELADTLDAIADDTRAHALNGEQHGHLRRAAVLIRRLTGGEGE